MMVPIGRYEVPRDTLVVAEVGNNHEGDFGRARELVRQAAACGAHGVKFQTYRARWFVRPADRERLARMSKWELSFDQFRELADLAHSLNLLFVSTPLDLESAAFLTGIVDAMKIASGDNNFGALLDAACGSGKPVIVSTGLSDMAQVKRTVGHIRAKGGGDRLVLLHCVTSYPAPPEQIHLRAMRSIAEETGVPVGYSDHTLGIEACLAAAALGACVIEKHFTLDKKQSDFRDHALSADPADLKRLVDGVRTVCALLGDDAKRLQPCEEALNVAARRSIVAAADRPRGHRLAAADLTWMRPADALPPGEEARLIGRPLKREVRLGEPIRPEDVS